jgi:glucose uptake protein
MFIPATFVIALLMTILSTICWGSFANTLKGTKNYRFELYNWDYTLGIFLMALILAFTMGSAYGGPAAFLANTHAADSSNLWYAGTGGFIFNIANVLLIAGIEITGLAVAFPLSIGIALAEGAVLAYILQPKGNPYLLGAGVLMGVLAVILVGKSYKALRAGSEAVSRKGVIVCVISGLLMGTWAPFVTLAMTRGHVLTPYSTTVFLTLGALICCCLFNPILMRKPIIGVSLSMGDYFRTPVSYHFLGLLGGCIWGIGMVFNLVAGAKVGVSISYAIGQASPMVACLWGVFVWKEFSGANAKAKGFLGAMFASYILAIILIASAH